MLLDLAPGVSSKCLRVEQGTLICVHHFVSMPHNFTELASLRMFTSTHRHVGVGLEPTAHPLRPRKFTVFSVCVTRFPLVVLFCALGRGLVGGPAGRLLPCIHFGPIRGIIPILQAAMFWDPLGQHPCR